MKEALIALFFGAIMAAAMAPYNYTLILFLSLSALYHLVYSAKTAKAAATIGFSFSFGYFLCGLSWVGHAFLVEGNPYWWVYPFAISGLPLILSPFMALTLYIYKRIERRLDKNIFKYSCFCLAVFIAELMRGTLFTGFPWNLYGYSWISIIEIAQIASLYNIYLLTLITIFWAVFPAYIIQSKQKTLPICILISTLIMSYIWGGGRIQTPTNEQRQNTEFVIVQPNIPQSEKWEPSKRAENFLKLIDLSRNTHENSEHAQSYYIVWPETALAPDLLNAPWAMDMIKETLENYPSKAFLITGALRQESRKYYNSILLINDDGEAIRTYNKHHLVPFGEYIPFDNIFAISPVVGFSGFVSGTSPEPFRTETGLNILPLICYEIIFPKYSHHKQADIIINVTNDAWYGDSAGPYQHLVQTQFRAIENNVPILRSANTGISAHISQFGQLSYLKNINQNGRIVFNDYFNLSK